jgi:hypothetical protein
MRLKALRREARKSQTSSVSRSDSRTIGKSDIDGMAGNDEVRERRNILKSNIMTTSASVGDSGVIRRGMRINFV